jgi:predicted MPP superfamily phosphohydrolase
LRFMVVVLALHVPLYAYPVLRLCHWLDLSLWPTLVIFLPLFFSQIVTRVWLRGHHNTFALWFRMLADLWLGISPIVLILVLFGELLLMFSAVPTYWVAHGVLDISLLLLVYSVYNAWVPTVVKVPLESGKLDHPLRFVQITDVHIGSRSSRFLEHVINKVNELEPEFLCITGDFVDAPGISEQRLSALKKFSGPIYFSIGNHEKYEDLPEIVQRLENLGVQVLRDRAIEAGPLQVIGIDDMEDPKQVAKQLSRMQVLKEKFVLLLYHRPRGLADAAVAGVDLMISGHTHNGQIVPFNFIVDQVFEMSAGLFREGDTHLYVSSGTGTWGPTMRLGTRSEITLFEINSSR